jgi:hypothetical protein
MGDSEASKEASEIVDITDTTGKEDSTLIDGEPTA